MTKGKLIAGLIISILFMVSIAGNIIQFIVHKNSSQKTELIGLRRENERLKRQSEVFRLYKIKSESIKKERKEVVNKIDNAESQEEINDIIFDIINYNNALVQNNTGSTAGEAD